MKYNISQIDDITVKEYQRVAFHNARTAKIGIISTLTLEQWVETLNLFDGLCAYCCKNTFTILDHVIPVTSGGGTEASNCVPCCERCNTRKGNRVLCDISDSPLMYKVEQIREAFVNYRSRLSPTKIFEGEVHARLPLGLADELKQLAKDEGRSLNWEITEAIRQRVQSKRT